jgi:fluoride exporter
MLGTAFLGAFRVLQSTVKPVSISGCRVLQGLGDGYCGCLTTVSTFAAEVDALRGWRAWFYVAASWGTGQIILLLVLEPPFWTGYTNGVVSCRT